MALLMLLLIVDFVVGVLEVALTLAMTILNSHESDEAAKTIPIDLSIFLFFCLFTVLLFVFYCRQWTNEVEAISVHRLCGVAAPNV